MRRLFQMREDAWGGDLEGRRSNGRRRFSCAPLNRTQMNCSRSLARNAPLPAEIVTRAGRLPCGKMAIRAKIIWQQLNRQLAWLR